MEEGKPIKAAEKRGGVGKRERERGEMGKGSSFMKERVDIYSLSLFVSHTHV